MSRLKKVPVRVWILIIALALAILAINPSPYAEGIQIKSIEQGEATDAGIAIGQILTHINGEPIDSLVEYNQIATSLQNDVQTVIIKSRF
jgi:S1-C subfamily serine protease